VIVILTDLALMSSFSGGGRKSLMILTQPIGSADKFSCLRFVIFFFLTIAWMPVGSTLA
jgi:hypothetical protein